MNIANPIQMLIREGVVINKWGDSKLPSTDNLLNRDSKSGKEAELLISLIIFFVPLLILKVTDRKK